MSIQYLLHTRNKNRDILEKISDFILYPAQSVWLTREVKILEKDKVFSIKVIEKPKKYSKSLVYGVRLMTCVPLAIGIILKKLDTLLNKKAKKHFNIIYKALKAKQKGYDDLEQINEIIHPIFDCTDSYVNVIHKTQNSNFCWKNVRFDLKKIKNDGLQVNLMKLDEQSMIDRVKEIHLTYLTKIKNLEIELNQ